MVNKDKKKDKITNRHFEIAYAMQIYFEKSVNHLIKILKKKSKIKTDNIVLAGGAAMNCVYNGKLLKNKTYKNSYIPSCPDDLGVSVGALLLTSSRLNPKKLTKIIIIKVVFGDLHLTIQKY